VITIDRPLDCPECSSAGSVVRDFCEICYAEIGEFCEPEDVPFVSGSDLPPTMVDTRPPLHPATRFRFADVVEELRAIADLASQAVEVEGSRLAAACKRAESLFEVLRLQFLADIGVGDTPRGASLGR
jgi:hypothetical protein